MDDELRPLLEELEGFMREIHAWARSCPESLRFAFACEVSEQARAEPYAAPGWPGRAAARVAYQRERWRHQTDVERLVELTRLLAAELVRGSIDRDDPTPADG